MRLIDADALLRIISDTRQEMLGKKELPASEFYIRDTMLTNFQFIINNVPTVEFTDAMRMEADE